MEGESNNVEIEDLRLSPEQIAEIEHDEELTVPLGVLMQSPVKIRREYSQEQIGNLENEIESHGLSNPLQVAVLPGYPGKLIVLAGSTRLIALVELAKKGHHVDISVKFRDLTRFERLKKRANLLKVEFDEQDASLLEEARLWEVNDNTTATPFSPAEILQIVEEQVEQLKQAGLERDKQMVPVLCGILNLTQPTVKSYLFLYRNLDPAVQKLLRPPQDGENRKHKLPIGGAGEIAKLQDREAQKRVAGYICSQDSLPTAKAIAAAIRAITGKMTETEATKQKSEVHLSITQLSTEVAKVARDLEKAMTQLQAMLPELDPNTVRVLLSTVLMMSKANQSVTNTIADMQRLLEEKQQQ